MTGVRPIAGTSRDRDEDLRNAANAATTDQHFHLTNLQPTHTPMLRATQCVSANRQQHGLSVRVHAYVLMPNHVHLLASPATGAAMPRMMQTLGRR